MYFIRMLTVFIPVIFISGVRYMGNRSGAFKISIFIVAPGKEKLHAR
jgi:hypothetical protein